MKRTDRFYCFSTVLFVVILIINRTMNYGKTWGFGRFGLPHTLLDPSGTTYRDGSAVDGLTLLLVRSGQEEALFLAGCVLILVIAAATFYLNWQTAKLEQQNAEIRAKIERLLRQ